MFLFGFLTMLNVRKVKYRSRSINYSQQSIKRNCNTHRKRFRSVDRHLFIMLCVQITFLALFTLPQAIQQIYSLGFKVLQL